MSEQNYESASAAVLAEGPLLCPTCGQEYSEDLKECPFCRAEELAHIITKKGSYRPRSAIAAGVLLSLALVAGGVLLFQAAQENGGWSIEQEYETTDTLQTVSGGITQQESSLDSVTNETEDTQITVQLEDNETVAEDASDD